MSSTQSIKDVQVGCIKQKFTSDNNKQLGTSWAWSPNTSSQNINVKWLQEFKISYLTLFWSKIIIIKINKNANTIALLQLMYSANS